LNHRFILMVRRVAYCMVWFEQIFLGKAFYQYPWCKLIV